MFEVKRIGEIVRQLSDLRYPATKPIANWRIHTDSHENRLTPNDDTTLWQPFSSTDVWGGDKQSYAFSATISIPEEFAGKPVEFSVRTSKEGLWDAINPQFTVYVDGILRQGFDTNHTSLLLSENAQAGQTYELFLSAFTGTDNDHLLFEVSLRTVDRVTEKLYYDMWVPHETLLLLQDGESAYHTLRQVLGGAVDLLDMRKPGSPAYYESVEKAERWLAQNLYNGSKTAEEIIYCVGHTHIDIAWLWTLAVTEDKAVRSFSTVLELMKRYPEYVFMSSQPQLYQYVKKNAPDVYAQIKERVREGRWEVEGSAFVEPDCNLSSGEALVRQILYGKKFFREEFGKENRIFWLPDVFGYAAALPQIMRKSGIDYFMTTKISWNEYNKQPFDTFYWKGIDGSKILTHFIPIRNYVFPNGASSGAEEFHTFNTTYVGQLHPRHLKGGWQRYQQKELNKEILCAYGFGDGGGGPTEWMIEAQRRTTQDIPGCPPTKSTTATAFFEKLKQSLAGKEVPVWSGELYLEYHRGTYTSMARNKKWNRRAEFALTNLEKEAVVTGQLLRKRYPDLTAPWEILMRNQFHDILPGSSILEVYEDSKREYQELFGIVDALEQDHLQSLADGVGRTIVWNPNGQSMSGFVLLEKDEGRQHVQKTKAGYLAWAGEVPANGYCCLPDEAPQSGTVLVSPQRVETPYAIILFNAHGHIDSWYDKAAQREILQPGTCGNVLMTYEDKPFQYDNWNIQDYYKKKSWPVEDLRACQVVENGPYRYGLEFTWLYQDTTIQETIYFYGNSPQVDVHFKTDWREDQILLKALFPLDLNTTEATFEIQYGNVKRSTTRNTSWEQARFEVCHHKWLDVAEGGFGVSILNDCKFGVSIDENVVGLSLLKSGCYPNPIADREHHEAIYSILPHQGSWKDSGVVQQAYMLNNPLRAVTPVEVQGGLPEKYSLAAHTHRNIMVEAAKRAEDGKGTILRLYEFENARTKATLHLGRKAKRVWLCDLMENKQEILAEDTDCVSLDVLPFAIESIYIED